MPDNRPNNPGEEADVEYPYNGNENLIRYYSELGYTVIQNKTGNEYGEAIDPYPSKYTYSISDNSIELEEDAEGVITNPEQEQTE